MLKDDLADDVKHNFMTNYTNTLHVEYKTAAAALFKNEVAYTSALLVDAKKNNIFSQRLVMNNNTFKKYKSVLSMDITTIDLSEHAKPFVVS